MLAGAVFSGVAALLALAGVLASLVSAWAATTEHVVVDRRGLAIGGFDPVAYFVDKTTRLGKGEFEHSFAGAVWRFHNPGNRAAFIAHPQVYMPRFGGYDPVGAARGAAVPGHPQLWVISDGRLYLFYSGQARDEFAKTPARIVALAEKNWPALLMTLTP
jgi:hypothetical protein